MDGQALSDLLVVDDKGQPFIPYDYMDTIPVHPGKLPVRVRLFVETPAGPKSLIRRNSKDFVSLHYLNHFLTKALARQVRITIKEGEAGHQEVALRLRDIGVCSKPTAGNHNAQVNGLVQGNGVNMDNVSRPQPPEEVNAEGIRQQGNMKQPIREQCAEINEHAQDVVSLLSQQLANIKQEDHDGTILCDGPFTQDGSGGGENDGRSNVGPMGSQGGRDTVMPSANDPSTPIGPHRGPSVPAPSPATPLAESQTEDQQYGLGRAVLEQLRDLDLSKKSHRDELETRPRPDQPKLDKFYKAKGHSIRLISSPIGQTWSVVIGDLPKNTWPRDKGSPVYPPSSVSTSLIGAGTLLGDPWA